MLGKILKYDMKSLGKKLGFLYLAVIFIALLSRGIGLLGKVSSIFQIAMAITQFVGVIFVIGMVLFTYYCLIQYFYQNFVEDNAYLINTLPVKKSTLILSKAISAVSYWICSFACALVALFILFYQEGALTIIQGAISSMASSLQISNTILLIGIIIYVLVASLSQIFTFYFAISIGQIRNTGKLISAFVAWLCIYFAYEMIALLVLGIMAFCNQDIFFTLETTTLPVTMIYMILGVGFLIQIVYLFISWIGTNYMLKNKLNLE